MFRQFSFSASRIIWALDNTAGWRHNSLGRRWRSDAKADSHSQSVVRVKFVERLMTAGGGTSEFFPRLVLVSCT